MAKKARNKDTGNEQDGSKEIQELPCNHPNWSHQNDTKDYVNGMSFLSLLADKDDVEEAIEELQERSDSGKIDHFKPKDILRASRLPLLPADNPDVAQHITAMKKGEKLSPLLVIRGGGDYGKHPVVVAGYHRACAAYYDDMNCPIPAVIINC